MSNEITYLPKGATVETSELLDKIELKISNSLLGFLGYKEIYMIDLEKLVDIYAKFTSALSERNDSNI